MPPEDADVSHFYHIVNCNTGFDVSLNFWLVFAAPNLDDVLHLLLGQDVSGGVSRVDDSNTSNLGAISTGSRECIAQVIHLIRQGGTMFGRG